MVAGVVVPNLVEYRGYVGRGILFLAFGHVQWVGDVTVVRDTAVFTHLQIIIVEDEMQVVFLSPIAGKQASVEQGGGLVVVHASAVDIVDVETDAEPFVGIDGKVGLEPFFTAPVVEAFVIGEVGEG